MNETQAKQLSAAEIEERYKCLVAKLATETRSVTKEEVQDYFLLRRRLRRLAKTAQLLGPRHPKNER